MKRLEAPRSFCASLLRRHAPRSYRYAFISVVMPDMSLKKLKYILALILQIIAFMCLITMLCCVVERCLCRDGAGPQMSLTLVLSFCRIGSFQVHYSSILKLD